MEDDGVECRIGEGVERGGMCVVTIIRILERELYRFGVVGKIMEFADKDVD
jgi:hypothetical protein